MPLPLFALGIAAAPSIIRGVSGIFQTGRGNKLARANKRPVEQANPLYAQNLAIAEQAARVGLPQQQYNQAQQNFQRNQAGALRQFGRMGNPRGLAGIVRAGNDATLGLDVADANARMGNQRFAMGVRGQLAGEQNRVWDWNNRQKYFEEGAAAEALQGAGRQNTFGALNDLSQIGQFAMMGNQGQSTMGQVMGNPYIPQQQGIPMQNTVGQTPFQTTIGQKYGNPYLNKLKGVGYLNPTM